MNYLVVAAYQSKYGKIIYCARLRDGQDPSEIDLSNVFLYTFYIKGDIFKPSVGSVYRLSYVTSNDNKMYAFPEG